MVMTEITSVLRFPGHMDSDLDKFVGIMVPFPRLHFLTSSFVSLSARNTTIRAVKVNRLIKQVDFRNL